MQEACHCTVYEMCIWHVCCVHFSISYQGMSLWQKYRWDILDTIIICGRQARREEMFQSLKNKSLQNQSLKSNPTSDNFTDHLEQQRDQEPQIEMEDLDMIP